MEWFNKDNFVHRAGCQSPLSIRLCPERTWISPDTCADVSQQVPPWAEWVSMTPTVQEHPVITHRRGLGDGGTVTGWSLSRTLTFQWQQKGCQKVTVGSRAGKDRQHHSASLADRSWLIIGINVTVCHSNLIRKSWWGIITHLFTQD